MLAIILAGIGHGSHGNATIGFLAWLLFSMVGLSGAEAVASEAASGTIERLFCGPRSHLSIIISELVSSGLVGLLRFAVVATVLLVIARQHLSWTWTNAAAWLLLLLFVQSLGLMVAAGTLVFRRIANVENFIQLGMLAIALATPSMPVAIAQFFPFTNAVALLDGAVSDPSADVFILAASTAACIVAAIALFHKCDQVALEKGLLVQM